MIYISFNNIAGDTNHQLANELRRPITRKFETHKVYSSYTANIFGVDLANKQYILSKYNKGIIFLLLLLISLLSVITIVFMIFRVNSWVDPLKDKRGITITSAFQKVLDKSGHKQNKINIDKATELYNRSMKSCLHDNYIEMYSIQNEGKSVVAGRFIRTLNNMIYKHMTEVSKNVYSDKLIVDKYNKKYHRAIKINPADVTSGTYIN